MKTPLSGYYGGKSRMREFILDIIAPVNWERYVEPFCGGAAVFFGAYARWKDNRNYVLNDNMELIVNFFRMAQSRPDALMAMVDERLIYAASQHEQATNILKSPHTRPGTWRGRGRCGTPLPFHFPILWGRHSVRLPIIRR